MHAKHVTQLILNYLIFLIIMCEGCILHGVYRGAAKSLARPGRKQATATEDCDVHISYL